MSHAYRFHVSSDTPLTGTFALPPDEAHHAARVVRVRPGEPVELFDGAGRVWSAVVEEVSKREVQVRVVDASYVEAPVSRLALLQAWPNHEKTAESIIRRATELGVTALAFFRGDHSERAPTMNEKWRRIAVESAKQCRRAWLPEFHAFPRLDAALESSHASLVVATMARRPVPIAGLASISDLALVVGPEGDLSHTELDLLMERGAHPISLGGTVFRAEIAVTVAIALIQYEQGQLGPRSGSLG
jgi:16S rRNA (uracil1498-N3)-methyltransferase